MSINKWHVIAFLSTLIAIICILYVLFPLVMMQVGSGIAGAIVGTLSGLATAVMSFPLIAANQVLFGMLLMGGLVIVVLIAWPRVKTKDAVKKPLEGLQDKITSTPTKIEQTVAKVIPKPTSPATATESVVPETTEESST